MKLTRRSLLAGLAAAPAAAQSVVSASAAQLAGVAALASPERFVGDQTGVPSVNRHAVAAVKNRAAYLDVLAKRAEGLCKEIDLPSAVHRRWQRARSIDHLDPDLATNRSMSLTAKLKLQADRNYRGQVEEIHARLRLQREDVKYLTRKNIFDMAAREAMRWRTYTLGEDDDDPLTPGGGITPSGTMNDY